MPKFSIEGTAHLVDGFHFTVEAPNEKAAQAMADRLLKRCEFRDAELQEVCVSTCCEIHADKE